MIPGNANPLLLASAAAAAAGDTGRSLRFNSGDSTHLSRTPSSAGNRKTFTFSCWLKRTKFGESHLILETQNGVASTPRGSFQIDQDDRLRFNANPTGSSWIVNVKSENLLRDPAAWYHLVCSVDTTQSTAGNRVRLYINNEEIYYNTADYPTQNTDLPINQALGHRIGASSNNSLYVNGYLANIVFVDGSQLTPSSFGAYDSNGVWQHADYSGTYGTQGYALNFTDSSSLGDDSSGNNNDWTPSNFSTTAGSGNDLLFDNPTNGTATDTGAGGEVNGNYCTFNPVDSNQTHSNGNLFVTCAGGTSPRSGTGTIAVSSGKYYYEITVTESDAAKGIIGFVEAAYDGNGSTIPNSNGNSVFYFGEGGQKFIDGSSSSYGASYGNNDVIGVALNLDDDEITFYKNGTSQGTITTKTFTGAYKPAVGRGASSGSTSYTLNAGQRAFTHAAPSGFKTLNTASLPTPTVADGSDYHDTVLYTGNGASSRTISGYSFSPDFLWVKVRTNTGGDFSPRVMDAVRGAGVSLRTNGTDAERDSSATTGGGVETFTSDGFTIEAGGGSNINANNNNSPYVAWGWDAGSSTVSNTDGSVTSSVRANQSAGFSIVSYTGNGSSGTVGHGLNAAPEMIIAKDRDASTNWFVYHTSLGSNAMLLNSTAAAFSPAPAGINAASSSTFTLGGARGETNTNGNDYIAYCFAPVSGYQALGQFTGNADSGGDGPFVHTGFAVQWLLIKGYDASNDHWKIYENARSPFNVRDDFLSPNSSNAETTSNNNKVDFLSNGFKLRTTGGGDSNLSSKRYIYLAIAENPFQANGGLAR